ncbi:hypothetical protein [Streptomyces sp. NPDC092307]|uniref:hypothetical protein n=1 Tax=Streptomyces sp. NPDC092307 TaxID=3366013 RepID=UPI0038053991
MNDHSGYRDPLPAARTAADIPVPEAVPNPALALPHPETYLTGRWAERNRRNAPGPFYAADTDTCWTGRMAAPDHVVHDDATGQEIVYRRARGGASEPACASGPPISGSPGRITPIRIAGRRPPG